MEAEIGGRVRERISAMESASTHKEIAQSIDMTPDAFSRALSGQRAFSAVELVALADLLKTSVHWFVTGEDDPFTIRVAGRHTFDRTTMSDRPVDWANARRPLDGIALAYQQADDVTPLSGIVPPSPIEARRVLVQKYGDSFVRELANNIETAFGVAVVRIQEVTDAFAIEMAGHRVIVVASTGNWWRQNWSIAHELGHLVENDLSPLADPNSITRPAEERANAFAAELLLPAEEMRATPWSTLKPEDVARLIWKYGVSTEALTIRLSKLNIPIAAPLRTLLDQPTARLLRAHRPDESKSLTDEITQRMEDASARRFPGALVASHQEASAAGRRHARTLEWMLGLPAGNMDESGDPGAGSADLDQLARELGLLDSDPT